jgi:hypothetical protein
MTRTRWIAPALAGLLIVAAAMWASAGQPAGADSPAAPQDVLAADIVPLTPDADAYVDSVNSSQNYGDSRQLVRLLGRDATRRTLLHFPSRPGSRMPPSSRLSVPAWSGSGTNPITRFSPSPPWRDDVTEPTDGGISNQHGVNLT